MFSIPEGLAAVRLSCVKIAKETQLECSYSWSYNVIEKQLELQGNRETVRVTR